MTFPSVTHTWVGRELLSQEAGVSSDMVYRVMRDLEDLGWIRKTQRSNSSLMVTIYLTPMLDKNNPPEPVPVSIAPEDMGHYVCQAAIRLREEAAMKDIVLPADFSELTDMTDWAFRDHRCSKIADSRVTMTKALLECVRVAGSVHRCHRVISHHLDPTTEATQRIHDAMQQADDPAAYIANCFPTWINFYPYPLPEIDPDDISLQREGNHAKE